MSCTLCGWRYFFYNVTNEAGTVALIGRSLPRLTSDRAAQSLLISWVFVSLLQGVGGFGVPVAVVAPLLVGLGYSATQSVIMASLGHGWAVTFGSLGTSFVALTAVTGLPGEALAHDAALILGMACLISGSLVAYVSAGWSGFLRSIPMLLAVGAAMGLTQWWIATNGIWTLGLDIWRLGGRRGRRRLCAFTTALRQNARPARQPAKTVRAALYWHWRLM